jgi:hypothetical protein
MRCAATSRSTSKPASSSAPRRESVASGNGVAIRRRQPLRRLDRRDASSIAPETTASCAWRRGLRLSSTLNPLDLLNSTCSICSTRFDSARSICSTAFSFFTASSAFARASTAARSSACLQVIARNPFSCRDLPVAAYSCLSSCATGLTARILPATLVRLRTRAHGLPTILSSSTAEHPAVNRRVAGSNPA